VAYEQRPNSGALFKTSDHDKNPEALPPLTETEARRFDRIDREWLTDPQSIERDDDCY
jgi:hypothetical protein